MCDNTTLDTTAAFLVLNTDSHVQSRMPAVSTFSPTVARISQLQSSWRYRPAAVRFAGGSELSPRSVVPVWTSFRSPLSAISAWSTPLCSRPPWTERERLRDVSAQTAAEKFAAGQGECRS